MKVEVNEPALDLHLASGTDERFAVVVVAG
jgi:hypothetical protein